MMMMLMMMIHWFKIGARKTWYECVDRGYDEVQWFMHKRELAVTVPVAQKDLYCNGGIESNMLNDEFIRSCVFCCPGKKGPERGDVPVEYVVL